MARENPTFLMGKFKNFKHRSIPRINLQGTEPDYDQNSYVGTVSA